MLPISLCMIVKDEESCVNSCLSAAKFYFDDIIIVDTGSKDSTKDICKKYTDKIYDFIWIDDFSAARNYSISFAKHNWVLCLDADEVIHEFNEKSITKFIENKSALGRILINSTHQNDMSKSWVTRLFSKEIYSYSGSIHEQLIDKLGNFTHGENIDISVIHSGYEEATFLEKKYQRNLLMLKKALAKSPDDYYILFHLGKVYFGAKKYYKALDCFTKFFNTTPNYKLEYVKDALICFGYCFINTKKAAEFLNYKSYLQHYLSSPDVVFVYAYALMNCGEFSKAADMFIECTKLDNPKEEGINSYKAFYNAGVIFQCTNNAQKAKELYEKCGDYPPALNQLKIL